MSLLNPLTQGVKLYGPITIPLSSSLYGTHFSQFGVGGFVELSNINERNNIPIQEEMNADGISSGRRKIGMLVYVVEENKYFRLIPFNTSTGNKVTSLEWSTVSDAQKMVWLDPTSSREEIGTFITINGSGNPNECWEEVLFNAGLPVVGNFLPLSGGTITGNLTVDGSFMVNGSATFVNAENLIIEDPLIFLAQNNPANLVDIGIVGQFINSPTQFTGLVRDHQTNEWYLFSGLTGIPITATDIDFTDTNLKIDTLRANLIGHLLSSTLVFGDLSAENNVYGDNINYKEWDSTFGTVSSLSATWGSGFSTLSALSAKWESNYNTVSSLSANWQSTFGTVSSLSANWQSTFGTVSSLSANWQSTFGTVSSLSANWQSTFGTVSSLSATWGSGFSTLSALSANWQSTFGTVSSLSANWQSTFGTVSSLSATWGSGFSTLSALSAKWESNYNTVSSLSATWGSGFSTLSALSANWQSTFRTVSSLSANWQSTFGTVSSLSATWGSGFSTLSGLSANWQSTFGTVSSLSANWQSTFGTVSSLSAKWESNYTTTNSLSANWQSTFGTVSSLSADWSDQTSEVLIARIFNDSGTTLQRGYVVYTFGAQGDTIAVKLASNTSESTSSRTLGLVRDTTIAPNNYGYVTLYGTMDKLHLKTSPFEAGITFNAGDELWLGAIPGSYTNVKPIAPNHGVYLGVVERDNNGNGIAYVKVQNGYELNEIHDVRITSLSAKQVLRRNSLNTVWENVDDGFNWDSVYTTVNTYSGDWQDTANDLNKYLPLSGGVITGDLSVMGTFTTLGTATYLSSVNLAVDDSLIHLAKDNPANILDIGIVGHFKNPNENHSGFVKDSQSGEWFLFSNLSSVPLTTTNIDFTTPSLTIDILNANLRGNLVTNTSLSGNLSATGILYALGGNSNNWNSTFGTVSSLSATWGSGFSTLSALSANWQSTFGTVSSLSANWQSTFGTVSSLSATWGSGFSTLSGLSGNWQSTFGTVSSLSANWQSTFGTVSSLSATWGSGFSTLSGLSGNWQSTFGTVSSLSATWESNYNTVSSLSANWQSTFGTVSSLSANWESTFGTVSSLSANWQSAYSVISGVILSGGNSFGNTLVIGTNDPYSFVLETSGSPRMTILSGGNIGIGTSVPNHALTVSGDISANAIRLLGGTTTTNAVWFGTDVNLYRRSANVLRTDDAFECAIGSNTTSNLVLVQGTNNAVNARTVTETFWSAGTTLSGLSGNWQSTFGTVSSLSATWGSSFSTLSGLSANWESTFGTVSSLSATWGSSFSTLSGLSANWESTFGTVSSLSANWQTAYSAISGVILSGGNSFGDTLVIGTNDPYNFVLETSGSPRMTILSGGNIGIGTSVPNHALTVSGDISANAIRLPTGTSSIPAIYIGTDVNLYRRSANVLKTDDAFECAIGSNTTSNTVLVQGSNNAINSRTANSAIWNTTASFLTADSSSPLTQNYVVKSLSASRLVNSQIFDNGTNVGIGTTTPNEKLTVVGSISATDYVYNRTNLKFVTTNYTFSAQDQNLLVLFESISPLSAFVPNDNESAFSVGASINFASLNGIVYVAGNSGVTIRAADNRYYLRTTNSTGTVMKIRPNEWLLFGDIWGDDI